MTELPIQSKPTGPLALLADDIRNDVAFENRRSLAHGTFPYPLTPRCLTPVCRAYSEAIPDGRPRQIIKLTSRSTTSTHYQR